MEWFLWKPHSGTGASKTALRGAAPPSATPRLGPFKKGAFHVAMQAGVPIVPVVLRNAGELMPAHAVLVSSGVLDIAVLPPVPTTGWTKDDLDAAVVDVRQMFLDTLANWPR